MSADVLIVEDDPDVAEHIETVLISLGHRSQIVASQAEALAAIDERPFDLALVDLQIPAISGRGGADIEFGVNLLQAVRERRSIEELPVMIMTSHAADCLNLVGKLKHLGANEFISKPFQTKGWTLSRAVQKLLVQRARWQKASQDEVATGLQRFAGGELHFGATRVTLCGVTVLVNSKGRLMQAILKELSDQNSFGQYVSLSGPELAERLMNVRGSNAIAGAIKSFRTRVAEALADRYSVALGPSDVICSGGPGYRFNPWIRVSFADQPEPANEDNQVMERSDAIPTVYSTADALQVVQELPSHESLTASQSAVVELLKSDSGQVSQQQFQRRGWIIAQLRLRRQLRTPDIAVELNCSVKTIRNDIDSLRKAGRIEFVGAAKSGYYRLKT